ncbi:hypothetical protein ABT369_38830 [Dactylosporangium sp. NPDC000244]|uniref:hypothetical protein n=1 Tax=Dactylosporangium sp. NPDC000244 TaxID=3154365 RepID=UPI00332AC99D
MVAQKQGGGPTSPWQFYDSGGDYQGRSIVASVTFGADQVLTGGSVTRDTGCVYTKIIVGELDEDGQPSGTAKTINVANLNGTRSFSKAQLNAAGLVTVADISGYQITAAP